MRSLRVVVESNVSRSDVPDQVGFCKAGATEECGAYVAGEAARRGGG
jgi:hypothetical protein